MSLSQSHRLVVINQSAGYLMIDILYELDTKYDEVILMSGKVNPRNRPLPDSVKLINLITYQRESTWKRIYTWKMAYLKALWLIMTKYRNADLFLVSNPPIVVFLPLCVRNPFSILIYDVYPDALIEFDYISKGGFIAKTWASVNRRIFNRARNIYTISEGMAKCLSAYIAKEKIKVIPVWTDNSFLKPMNEDVNPFIQSHQLNGKFVIMYSGNLGKSHELGTLLDLAKSIDKSDILFLIIGEGDQSVALTLRIQKEVIHNIKILPWQDTSILPYSMAAASIAVVSLGKGASLLSVPSKTYNFMSVGAPLLCIASPESELSALVSKYEMGKCFERKNLEGMRVFVLELYKNPVIRQKMSQNALKATSQFTPDNAKKFVHVEIANLRPSN